MAVTMNRPVQIADGMWLVSGASDDPTASVRLWFEGQVLAIADDTFSIIVGSDAEPMVEANDDGGATRVNQQNYPGRATLQWFGVTGAAEYYVYQYVSGAWVQVYTIIHDGYVYHTYISDWLSDCATAQFKVVPVDSAGNVGSALQISMFIVRNPDVPVVSYNYSSGTGLLTVSAA